MVGLNKKTTFPQSQILQLFAAMNPLITSCKAVIFDMDGLLVDSEPYWKMAEKEVFGKLGLTLTDELLRQVMGFRLNEVVRHWYQYQAWPNPNFEQTETDVLACVQELIIKHAEALPGVLQLLETLKHQHKPMALASSSAMSLIETVVDKLKIRHYFDFLVSAETEPYGKPHPAIFLTTAQKLQVSPTDCLVFEDSLNGVIAAKAARMVCIAVPDASTIDDKRFVIADGIIPSLTTLIG